MFFKIRTEFFSGRIQEIAYPFAYTHVYIHTFRPYIIRIIFIILQFFLIFFFFCINVTFKVFAYAEEREGANVNLLNVIHYIYAFIMILFIYITYNIIIYIYTYIIYSRCDFIGATSASEKIKEEKND